MSAAADALHLQNCKHTHTIKENHKIVTCRSKKALTSLDMHSIYGLINVLLTKQLYWNNNERLIVFLYSHTLDSHTGNSRKRICIESTTATKTKAYDKTSSTCSHVNSVALALLCSGWTFALRSDMEDSSSATTESATIVSCTCLCPTYGCCSLSFYFWLPLLSLNLIIMISLSNFHKEHRKFDENFMIKPKTMYRIVLLLSNKLINFQSLLLNQTSQSLLSLILSPSLLCQHLNFYSICVVLSINKRHLHFLFSFSFSFINCCYFIVLLLHLSTLLHQLFNPNQKKLYLNICKLTKPNVERTLNNANCKAFVLKGKSFEKLRKRLSDKSFRLETLMIIIWLFLNSKNLCFSIDFWWNS